MEKNNGGPAYPSVNDIVIGDIGTPGHKGMTLRDYFAGQALAGMRFKNGASILEYATDAYNIADAMIAERAK